MQHPALYIHRAITLSPLPSIALKKCSSVTDFLLCRPRQVKPFSHFRCEEDHEAQSSGCRYHSANSKETLCSAGTCAEEEEWKGKVTNRLFGYTGEESEECSSFKGVPTVVWRIRVQVCSLVFMLNDSLEETFVLPPLCMCVCVCVFVWIILGLSPQQHVAGVAGGDPFKGVHMKLVEIVGGVLRSNVGSKQDKTHNKNQI